ncbi:2TM domain-containing protein [Aquimarina sp. MMG015]|uniref:2TM domain-containing protein n=1 Tax=unclassified Aquimarina TaxID=2627091 RepID=UPI000E555B2C|nr:MULTISPECIES: 2TM domain-containing protein [unclassified Aquimarina]AXT54229.1 histidine kinase [Aquimarina sp. AD1]MBQ4804237.1 2TM domain-containing protein [Aquimarina sp. MMG015]RKN25087.1 histidine kinase [Aquimarina sp. AD1]
MQDYEEKDRYELAKKRVDDERGFYTHLTFYIVINIVILIINTNSDNQGFKSWSQWHLYITPALWGIGLLFHGLKVFKHNFIFGKNWEERKIKELMDEEDTPDVS